MLHNKTITTVKGLFMTPSLQLCPAQVGNYEGLAVGPELPDGRRLLLAVTDDNFSPAQRGTQFVAFALSTDVGASPAEIVLVWRFLLFACPAAPDDFAAPDAFAAFAAPAAPPPPPHPAPPPPPPPPPVRRLSTSSVFHQSSQHCGVDVALTHSPSAQEPPPPPPPPPQDGHEPPALFTDIVNPVSSCAKGFP